MVSLLTHPSATGAPFAVPIKKQPRTVRGIGGFGSARVCYTHANTMANGMAGLMERLFYVSDGAGGFTEPPRPTARPDVVLAGFRARVLRRVDRPTVIPLAEVPLWFSGSRRKRIARAVERLTLEGLRRKDMGVMSFPKPEKWWKRSVPRVIQGPTPEYCASLARFLKPLEHNIFNAIDSIWRYPTVMKGKDQDKRGRVVADAWNQFSRPVAVGMDASRFDQHVSVDMLRWEHSIYKAIFGNDSELCKLLQAQIKYRGTMVCNDGIVRYRCEGRRRSGDLNTSLGNILIMCGMCYTYIRSLGLEPGRDVRLVNDGDDCVFIMDESNLDRLTAGIPDYFRALGFTMVVEPPARIIEAIEFCQSRMVCVDGEWRMVRNLGKALQQDVQLIKDGQFNAVEWCKAVGLCGLHVARGVPMLQSFYKAMTMGATTSKVLMHADFRRESVSYLAGGHTCSVEQPISDLTRVSFWRTFGVCPAMQEAYENMALSFVPDFSTTRISVAPGPNQKTCVTEALSFLSTLFN